MDFGGAAMGGAGDAGGFDFMSWYVIIGYYLLLLCN